MTNEGAAVHGVGPGSTLGGRYVVGGRAEQHARYERWLATDQTLLREVVLLCFPVDGATAAAALDAARRAAGIDDARLVRVLDVGRDGEVAFVVEEPLATGLDLVELVDGGPLPAGEARRLVGEAATALERARVRGLHHGVLGPRSLLRLDDGAVKVRGLAVEGALLGLDDVGGAQASRDDAVGLVALAYAALTGHWPLTTPVGPYDGLPAAPTLVSGIMAASEITAGVPADLDTITRLTLGAPAGSRRRATQDARGPLTPGDLAGQIAPWAKAADPTDLARPSKPPRSSAPVAPPTPEPTSAQPVPPQPVPPPLVSSGSPASPGSVSSGGQPPAGAPGGQTVLGMRVGDPGATSAAAASAAGGGKASRDLSDTDSLDLRALSDLGALGAAETASAAATTGAAGARWADTQEDEVSPYGERGSVVPPPGGPLRMTAHVRLSDTLEETDEDLDPALPLGGRRTAAAPSSDHTGAALVAVAALVIVAAVLGVFGVSRIGRSSTQPVAPATTTTSARPAATPTPSGSATTTAPTVAAALTPIGIVQAQAWDPQGDNQEGNASASRSVDGDPSTLWRSQTYRTAAFGGLAKTGIGLILDLGQQTTVKQVQVDLRGGSDLTAYVASRESLDGATSIGTSTGVDGTVTFTAPPEGAKGQLVILWFTRLASDGGSGYQAQVAEVRVSG